MRAEAKSGGALLIGVDLRKDRTILEAAYNDRPASRPSSTSTCSRA